MTAPTPNAALAYRVTFERIGRNHSVSPLDVEAAEADELAERIYQYGKRFLGSREVEVIVDMEVGTGWFSCGGRNGGRFTFVEDLGPRPDGGEGGNVTDGGASS